jgi:molybdate transport system substrate-binding protein
MSLPTTMLVAAMLLLTGCEGGGGASAPPPAGGDSANGHTGDITVLAAASLTEVFTELGRTFERRHPGTHVDFSFAGSSELAAQVISGAPADVLASASRSTMDQVVTAGLVAGRPTVIARNRLTIAVPAGNPGDVTGLRDFGRTDLAVALCAPEVPCGESAEQVLAAADVAPSVDTYESDAKATLTKVILGEVDAALVYRTDVLAVRDRDRVERIGIPAGDQAAIDEAVNDYPIAVLAEAPNQAAARAFVALVRSDAGATALKRAGFEPP